MDFDRKQEGRTFVVGLEILDNMPHDRLMSPQSIGEGKDSEKFTHVSMVERTMNPEELKEVFKPLTEVDDQLIKLFIECWETQPELDHVTANKRLKS